MSNAGRERRAARDVIAKTINDMVENSVYTDLPAGLYADEIVAVLESAGYQITDAASAAAGSVTISRETANWASAGLDHAPWSEIREIQDGVREAKDELHAAIAAESDNEQVLFRIAKFIADFASEDQQGYHWSGFMSDARGLIAVLAEDGYTITRGTAGKEHSHDQSDS